MTRRAAVATVLGAWAVAGLLTAYQHHQTSTTLPSLLLQSYDAESRLVANDSVGLLTLDNRSPYDLRVTAVRALAPGARDQRVDVDLRAGTAGTFQVPIDAACPSSVKEPAKVVVSATTGSRHGAVTVTLKGGDFGREYLDAQQDHCGLQDATRSFVTTRTSLVGQTSRSMTLRTDVRNRARRPRTITAVRAFQNFEITTPGLPRAVPANGTAQLTSTLVLTSCLGAADLQSDQDFARYLAVTVDADGLTGSGDLEITGRALIALRDLVEAACGDQDSASPPASSTP